MVKKPPARSMVITGLIDIETPRPVV